MQRGRSARRRPRAQRVARTNIRTGFTSPTGPRSPHLTGRQDKLLAMASISPSVAAVLGRFTKAATPVNLDGGVPLELPGRGRTCVIDMAGPPGAPTVILIHALATKEALAW